MTSHKITPFAQLELVLGAVMRVMHARGIRSYCGCENEGEEKRKSTQHTTHNTQGKDADAPTRHFLY
jgi:hypothetical protein